MQTIAGMEFDTFTKFVKIKSEEPKIFITGDCHGDFARFDRFAKNKDTNTNDIMICLGDFGVNYFLNSRDKKNKQKLSKLPFTFLIVQGNHEQYPEYIKSYQLKDINTELIKGKFYVEDEFPNLLFFKNGETYQIKNKSYLVLGGAYSVDKFFRLQSGYAWFPHEQMSIEEMNDILYKLENSEIYKYNYVLSHTCPYKYMPTHLFLSCIDQSTVDNRTEEFLDEVNNIIDYDTWFCGHYHSDEPLWDKGYMLYELIKEIF